MPPRGPAVLSAILHLLRHHHRSDRAATGMRGLLEHVGINLTGRDITVAGEVVDRAPLRDRIRRAVCEAEGFAWDTDMLEPDEYGEVADAVLAVLDAPADRAAVLHEAADELAAEREATDINVAVYPRYDNRQQLALGAGERRLRRLAADAAAGVQPPTSEEPQ